jgi:hypothetical protein
MELLQVSPVTAKMLSWKAKLTLYDRNVGEPADAGKPGLGIGGKKLR